jgi:hypothetical protein
MKRSFSRVLGILFCSVLAVSSIYAQSPQVPFAIGETLTYEGKISKVIQGISVAELTFTVGNGGPDGAYLVSAEARSKGTLLRLFRYSFLQKIDSTIAANDLRALKTTKHDVQKERVRNSEAVFDYTDRRVTYTETDPKEPMRAPRMIASDRAARPMIWSPAYTICEPCLWRSEKHLTLPSAIQASFIKCRCA